MNLVAELAAERTVLVDETRKLMDQLASAVRTDLEATGSYGTTLIVLEGVIPTFFRLHWKNPGHKLALFQGLEAQLAERSISATVYTFPGEVELKDGSTETAVIIVAHTANWKEMRVIPFRMGDEGVVQWAVPIVESDFQAHLFSHPYGELT